MDIFKQMEPVVVCSDPVKILCYITDAIHN